MNAYPENFYHRVARELGRSPSEPGTARLAADLAKPTLCREASMRRQMGLALRESADRLAAATTNEPQDQGWEDAAWQHVRAAQAATYAPGIRYCIKVADELGGLTTDELLCVMGNETDGTHWEKVVGWIRRARNA